MRTSQHYVASDQSSDTESLGVIRKFGWNKANAGKRPFSGVGRIEFVWWVFKNDVVVPENVLLYWFCCYPFSWLMARVFRSLEEAGEGLRVTVLVAIFQVSLHFDYKFHSLSFFIYRRTNCRNYLVMSLSIFLQKLILLPLKKRPDLS